MKPLSQLKELAKQTRPKVSGADLSGLIDIIVRQNEVIESASSLCHRVRLETSLRDLEITHKEVSVLLGKIIKLKAEVKK